MARRKDLKTTDLVWNTDDIRTSLDNLYAYVTNRVERAIEWYLKSKRTKKWGAVGLRCLALLLGSGAAVLPILAQIYGAWVIQPAWASVALVAAGTLVAFDWFLGCSSSWVRYVVAGLRLQKLLGEFQIDWHQRQSAWKSSGPDARQVTAQCHLAQRYLREADQLILEETQVWAAEFQKALAQVDALVKAKEPPRNGS
jgi:hypothetical protein